MQNYVTVYYDSQNVIHLVNHQVYHKRIKHMIVDVALEDNLTNVFTKFI